MTRKTDKTLLNLSNRRLPFILADKTLRAEVMEKLDKGEFSSRMELRATTPLISERLALASNLEVETKSFAAHPMAEAIILEKTRPVLFIREGVYESAQLKSIEAQIAPYRTKMKSVISAVGRIELLDHDEFEWCGTAWRIEEDLLVTNRHVALVFAQRHGATFPFRWNQSGKQVRARVDFREEFQGAESAEFSIAEVLWVSEDSDQAPDVAFLRIKRDGNLPGPLELSTRKIESKQSIAVVGYPAKDSRNDAGVMGDIFQNIYDVKRFSPGQIVIPGDGTTWYATHDATTLGGNSGSAVFDLATQKVLGLHFGGSYRKTNFAVRASVLMSLLKSKAWVPVTKESFGLAPGAFSEKKRTKAGMEDRAGYEKDFLGVRVAMPKLGASHKVLKTAFEGNALPYTHFSIVMSETRRLPIVTAENIDGAKKIKLKRNNTWGYDPRIPKSAQVGHDEFYLPEAFDKGHMVRRENPGWGDTKEEASLGEEDSFVYTNAVPQMPQLNQRTWLSLENYVLENARTKGFQVSVFTGPVFRDDDPLYSAIAVPTDFWKVVAALEAETSELLVSAYRLSQEGMMPTEGFRYGPFKTYQVPLKLIEENADVRFSKAMRDADVFGGSTVEETLSTGRFIEIVGPEDIVLTKVK